MTMRCRLEALQLPIGLHAERVQWLYDGIAGAATTVNGSNTTPQTSPPVPRHVLYWMQTSVRSKYNYSLEYAIAAAHALSMPLHVVYFFSDRSVVPRHVTPRDPNAYAFATERHAQFAIEGLACVQQKLIKRGLSFQVFHHYHHPPAGSTNNRILDFCEEDTSDTAPAVAVTPDPIHRPTRSDLLTRCAQHAALVVTDRPYLRPWRVALQECVDVFENAACEYGLVQVEGDVVVPCEVVSTKEEFAARTIRPKIKKQLPKYLVELPQQVIEPTSQTVDQPLVVDALMVSLDVMQPAKQVLEKLDVDRSVGGVSCFRGGEDAASDVAKTFLETKLAKFADDRNEPSGNGGSNLSLYFHYGHISSVRLALNVHKRKSVGGNAGKDSFLEELIVRRELSVNLCVFNDHYDTMVCLPAYAKTTLAEHANDKREHEYTVEQLETGATYDIYWNAAQRELVCTGKMHGYMRMYWAKKILEWTSTPELGYKIALYLNNKYGLDAPDPNSYAGIAWSWGKHDQGWKERPIFGKVRYMNESGLKRKFRMVDYVNKIQALTAGRTGPSETTGSTEQVQATSEPAVVTPISTMSKRKREDNHKTIKTTRKKTMR